MGVMIFPMVLPWYRKPGVNLDPEQHKHSNEQYNENTLIDTGTFLQNVPYKVKLNFHNCALYC